jgi:hypothetical protein
MITNTLEIYASAEAIKALITLNIIRAERVGDLDTMPVSVVTAEVPVSVQLKQLLISQCNFSSSVPPFMISLCRKVLCVCGCFLTGFVTGLTALEVVLYFHKCAERRIRQVLCGC